MNSKRSKLLNKLSTIDQELDLLSEYLNNFKEEQLNFKKNEDSWSAIQVMHHLILSETLSLKYCKKKLSFNPDLKDINVVSRFNSFLLSFYLRVPIKIKAPAMVGSSAFPEKDTLKDTLHKWKDSRNNLKDFLTDVDEKYLVKEVYKHPFGMRISLSGMLSFYRSHFQRHRKQIMRILNN